MDEKVVKKEVDKIKDQVKDIIDTDKVKELIKNNQIEFEYNDIVYRVNKPTFKQKQETNQNRIEKYIELLKNDKYLLEIDLIKLYKKRGIDIGELDRQLTIFEKQINDYMLKLGKAIKEKKPESERDKYKDAIEKATISQQENIMKKVVLLDSSIETQINIYIYTYLTSLVTEKKVKQKWVKAWNSYEEFIAEEEQLVNIAVWNATLLAKNELPSLQ